MNRSNSSALALDDKFDTDAVISLGFVALFKFNIEFSNEVVKSSSNNAADSALLSKLGDEGSISFVAVSRSGPLVFFISRISRALVSSDLFDVGVLVYGDLDVVYP